MSAIRVKGAAEILGVSTKTVRLWSTRGDIPHRFNAAGHRVYDREELEKFLRERNGEDEPVGTIVFYTRSSSGDDVSLESQLESLTAEYGTPDEVFKDKASGLNENRPGLKRLLDCIKSGDVDKVCITHPDRLTRFGLSYLTEIMDIFGTELVVQNSVSEKEPHEVLMQDFMSLVTSFAGRFYGLRSFPARKRLLKEAEGDLDDRV